jgi:neutral ceramidase
MSALFCSCPSSFGKAAFTCNIGIADITPSSHVVLAGFAARKGLSTTIQTRLLSHCLVIRSPKGEKVCIITNDMMELDIDETTEMRDSISAKTGLPLNHIFMHNIHTHSAPRTGGSSAVPGGSNYKYSITYDKIIVDNAVKTIKEDKAYRPFTMEFGSTTCAINMNRGEKGGPCTHNVYVLRLMGKNKKPIVSLVNYCCHPVSLGPGSHVVSADFPGFETKFLKDAWGGEVFHFTSASGNVDPVGGPKSDTLNAYKKGRQMADSILMKMRFTKIKMNSNFKVCYGEAHLPFRVNHITPDTISKFAQSILNDPVDVSPTWKRDVANWRDQMIDKYKRGKIHDYLLVQIGAVNIGGFPILFTQGEPFNEYDVQLRREVGHPMLFIAYTNGQNSYLPSAHAYETPYYAYEKDQMFVYVKSPYPLSQKFPSVYSKALFDIVEKALKQ